MGIHLRAYRLRCYPTRLQRAELARLFGAARWVWNRCLAATSEAYSDPELKQMFGRGLSITYIDFSRVLTQLKKEPEFAWLAACHSSILIQSLRNLGTAYANFFSGRSRYPRYKKREHAQSIRFQLSHHQAHRLSGGDEGRLVLPQLGELRVVWSRRPDGSPKMVTVSRDRAGRFWASMAVEEPIEILPPSPSSLGVDVGLRYLAVLSDGSRIANPKKLHGKLRHLRRLSRGLSRKKRGSGRWRRQRLKVAQLHARIADARRDALHQASTSIVRRAGLIAIEDLNVAGMMKNRALARSIADTSIWELHRQLAYRARWYGRQLVQAARFEPTSQRCSTPGCQYRNRQLTLKDRSWRCPACGTEHDRDVNAARNILSGGLRCSAESGVGQGVPELMRVEGGRSSRHRRQPDARGRPLKREPVKSPHRVADGSAKAT